MHLSEISTFFFFKGKKEEEIQVFLHVLFSCLIRSPSKSHKDEGNIDSVIDLLQKGADVNAASYVQRELVSGENYETPLQAAAKHGYVKITKLLIENGGMYIAEVLISPDGVSGWRECSRFQDCG